MAATDLVVIGAVASIAKEHKLLKSLTRSLKIDENFRADWLLKMLFARRETSNVI